LPKVPFDRQKFTRSIRFIALVLVGLGALVGAGYFLVWRMPKDQVTIALVGPNTVSVGVETVYRVTLQNGDERNTLTDLSFSVKAGDGVVFSKRQTIGVYQEYAQELKPMAKHDLSVPVVVWGGQGTRHPIEVVARYGIGNSNARFEKTISVDVEIQDAAAVLSLSIPSQTVSGQDFSAALDFKLMTSSTLPQATLTLETPDGFSLTRAIPESSASGSPPQWDFLSLVRDGVKRVSVDGKISDAEGESRIFQARLALPVRGIPVTLAEAQTDLVVIANPLVMGIAMTGSGSNHAPIGSDISFQISFENNFNIPLKDLIITADISDPWIQPGSIRPGNGGFYSSRDRTIVWSGGTTPDLLLVNSRETGKVDFSVRLNAQYRPEVRNVSMNVRASISSLNKPKDIGGSVAATAERAVKIDGALQFASIVVFRDDPATGFMNTGFLPLKANQVTQFTAFFRTSAIMNDFTDIGFSTVLPANVRFEGRIRGDVTGTNFVYNPRTGELSWIIPSVAASTSKQIAIQLDAVPSTDQIGQIIPILNESFVSATDAFTGTLIQYRFPPVLSDLPDDPTVDSITGRITM
jgi:hypothetical protein